MDGWKSGIMLPTLVIRHEKEGEADRPHDAILLANGLSLTLWGLVEQNQ
jgi:hypothetical protein